MGLGLVRVRIKLLLKVDFGHHQFDSTMQNLALVLLGQWLKFRQTIHQFQEREILGQNGKIGFLQNVQTGQVILTLGIGRSTHMSKNLEKATHGKACRPCGQGLLGHGLDRRTLPK